jgi:hypothetical protein
MTWCVPLFLICSGMSSLDMWSQILNVQAVTEIWTGIVIADVYAGTRCVHEIVLFICSSLQGI